MSKCRLCRVSEILRFYALLSHLHFYFQLPNYYLFSDNLFHRTILLLRMVRKNPPSLVSVNYTPEGSDIADDLMVSIKS